MGPQVSILKRSPGVQAHRCIVPWETQTQVSSTPGPEMKPLPLPSREQGGSEQMAQLGSLKGGRQVD